MKNLTTKLGTLVFLTGLLGCSKPLPSSSSSQPTPAWDLEAHAQDVRTYLAIKEMPFPTLQTNTPYTSLPLQTTNSSPPSPVVSPSTPKRPDCIDLTHSKLATELKEATKKYELVTKNAKGLESSNTVLRTQLTSQAYKITAAEKRARLETQATHSFSNLYTQALGTNKTHQKTIAQYDTTTRKLMNENNGLVSSLAEAQIQQKRTKHTLAGYQTEEKNAKKVEQRIQAENILVQTLLATPGYTLPGSPLITASVHSSRLENLTTFHFALPRVLVTTESLEETLAQLGALGYKPANTQGAFSNWVQQAGLPLNAFQGYANTPLQLDRAAALCKAYHDSVTGPLPGIVTWTNATGLHLIGTEKAVNAWGAKK